VSRPNGRSGSDIKDAPGSGSRKAPGPECRPLVSIVVPAHNEAAIVASSLKAICAYLEGLEHLYRWELIFIDDGSTDGTGELAVQAVNGRPNVRFLTHPTNLGVGEALRNAFRITAGDYVVTPDLDLSYSVDHIGRLLERITKSGAKVVVASPYARGGQAANVPWVRLELSRWANRFLAAATKEAPLTLTGIMRAYDGRFLRALNLRSRGMEINPEIIYKALVMRARVEELPARLDWGPVKGRGRSSSMRVARHVAAVLVSGYLIKPFVFFVLPGLAGLFASLGCAAWLLLGGPVAGPAGAHIPSLAQVGISRAAAAAYLAAPHVFFISLALFVAGAQFTGLGLLAFQAKRNFDELFFLGTSIYQSVRNEPETRP
jgi:hypothetical protein